MIVNNMKKQAGLKKMFNKNLNEHTLFIIYNHLINNAASYKCKSILEIIIQIFLKVNITITNITIKNIKA